MNEAAENRRSAKHSSVSVEHFTPVLIVEPARHVLGGIDLDPASCEFANQVVAATRYFSQEDDGLMQEWPGRVFLNPPGGTLDKPDQGTSSRAVRWWIKLCEEYTANRTTAAIFIGFSLEILQSVQMAETLHPLDFPCCVPKSRIRFDVLVDDMITTLLDQREVEQAKSLVDLKKIARIDRKIDRLEPLIGQRMSGTQPTHANVIVLLPSSPDEVEAYAQAFSHTGKVTRGSW